MHAREPRRGNVNIMLRFLAARIVKRKAIGNVLYTHFAWRVVNNGASWWTLLVQRKRGTIERKSLPVVDAHKAKFESQYFARGLRHVT
jgi:hypothetical protein